MTEQENEQQYPVVRFVAEDTGEIKERSMGGVERSWLSEHFVGDDSKAKEGRYFEDEWEATALDLALALVPDLQDAIDRCRIRGRTAEVIVREF